jgi:hypothetical protein
MLVPQNQLVGEMELRTLIWASNFENSWFLDGKMRNPNCRKAAICFYHPISSDVPFNCPYQPIRQVGHNQNYYQVYKVTIALAAQ